MFASTDMALKQILMSMHFYDCMALSVLCYCWLNVKCNYALQESDIIISINPPCTTITLFRFPV